MKKGYVPGIGLLLLLAVTGCTNTIEETKPLPMPVVEGETQEDEIQEINQAVSVTIYYGNAQADGLEKKEVEISALTPENLVGQLSVMNVVSIDTKVNSFTQEGTALKLDLSKGFVSYLNMMGTSGEYIVMGGIVNTFLDAYDAENILITVEGGVLETGHASYEAPLTFFETGSANESEEEDSRAKEPVKYRLTDETYQKDGVTIYYPQFVDMSDSELEKEWNEMIRKIAIESIIAEDTEDIAYVDCKVDYEIASCDTEFVSFVFRITGAEPEVRDTFAISFDMVDRKVVRLSDWKDALDETVGNLTNRGYYKILNKDIDREEFDEIMKPVSPSADEYREEFMQYDYDSTDLTRRPYGTSYIKDGNLVIIMDMKTAAGNTVEIDTGIRVR
ncbi:MAG: GerMN domain-containing protein [Lachnospiraceae bacterium]|nr:GerMN domain-containing protein [Lachnospiraceae bacterium]